MFMMKDSRWSSIGRWLNLLYLRQWGILAIDAMNWRLLRKHRITLMNEEWRTEDTKPSDEWEATHCNEVHLKFYFYWKKKVVEMAESQRRGTEWLETKFKGTWRSFFLTNLILPFSFYNFLLSLSQILTTRPPLQTQFHTYSLNFIQLLASNLHLRGSILHQLISSSSYLLKSRYVLSFSYFFCRMLMPMGKISFSFMNYNVKFQ